MRSRTLQIKARKQSSPAIIFAVLACFLAVVTFPRSRAQYIEAKTTTPVIPISEVKPFTFQEFTPPSKDLRSVYAFVESYPGSLLKGDYMQVITAKCNNNPQLIRQVVAIATAETGQGKASPLSNNFWGWYKGGNRQYNPDRDTMAADICTGISTYYSDIDADIASIYTGGDRTSNWYSIYTWAMSQMPE